MNIIHYTLYIIIALGLAMPARAQVTGKVVDSKSRRALDYVTVRYEGTSVGTLTDEKGLFAIREDSVLRELTISSVGYKTQTIKLKGFGTNQNLAIRLVPDTEMLQGVTIAGKRKKYSRKNNPAVELINKVIANKKRSDLRAKDFHSYTKYEKMTFSLNDMSEESFTEGKNKVFAFMKDHLEKSPQTGKLILPLTVDETVSEHYYRKKPLSEKRVIKAESNRGVSELVNTGEILTTKLKDFFTDVDIYENECRLLQHPFKSPIADNAVSFYRYYLQDTLLIGQDKVVDVGFLPNNPQDFGFSGHLHILLDPDSTFQVRRVELNIPGRSDVNFVENMVISQDFVLLESGERVAATNDMLIELELTDLFGKMQVQRVTRLSDVRFDPIPDEVFKSVKGSTRREPDALLRDETYWSESRPVPLTESEGKVGNFLTRLTQIKGFKYVMFAFRALVENFVETGDSLHPSKVDIGPINTVISANHYDGLRLRASAQTTANLSPHLFGRGYISYGTQTRNIYGKAELTYSFNKKAYLPIEYPQHNLTITWWNDIMSPFDKYIPTDKDNIFTVLRASKVDQFHHMRELRVDYTHERENGLKINAQFARTRLKPVDALFYQRLDGNPVPTPPHGGTQQSITGSAWAPPAQWEAGMTLAEIKAGITFEPNATYFNTKKRRSKVNLDTPVFSLTHTMGVSGLLGGQYNYNLTEIGVYKRFWLGTFGRIDTDFKAGALWDKVPYPLLIHPAANTSFIMQKNTFALITNYEFLNDRYASLMLDWDLKGHLFNRIPLLRRLKWRERIGVNALWGQLTDRNNPAASGYADTDLFHFPGHFNADGTYEQNTVMMDTRTPYVEVRVGIHNILKLFEIDYVRRLTYRHNPNANNWGVRLRMTMSF